MTIHTLLLWFLTSGALLTSIFALFVALRTSGPFLSRQLSALSMTLREQQTNLDELTLQLKAMRQRENMRAYRRRKGGESSETDDEPAGNGREWVQSMNERLARARLGVPK